MTRSQAIKLLQDKANAQPELLQGELFKKAVADALEEVAELCKIKSKQAYRHSEEAGMSFDDLEAQIRALIKRNAKEGE